LRRRDLGWRDILLVSRIRNDVKNPQAGFAALAKLSHGCRHVPIHMTSDTDTSA